MAHIMVNPGCRRILYRNENQENYNYMQKYGRLSKSWVNEARHKRIQEEKGVRFIKNANFVQNVQNTTVKINKQELHATIGIETITNIILPNPYNILKN